MKKTKKFIARFLAVAIAVIPGILMPLTIATVVAKKSYGLLLSV